MFGEGNSTKRKTLEKNTQFSVWCYNNKKKKIFFHSWRAATSTILILNPDEKPCTSLIS
jgi:hypothetical protein